MDGYAFLKRILVNSQMSVKGAATIDNQRGSTRLLIRISRPEPVKSEILTTAPLKKLGSVPAFFREKVVQDRSSRVVEGCFKGFGAKPCINP